MGRRWRATERKAKLLGVFITSDCEADAYAPLVQANVSRYAQRALKVRVKVGAEEIAVKERGLVRWKTDRLPVRLLRTAHASIDVPELAFFVVQTDDRRFKVLAFLFKTADDAWCLVERARQSRQLRDALRHGSGGGGSGSGIYQAAPPQQRALPTRPSFSAASPPVAAAAVAQSNYPHCCDGGDHRDAWHLRHRWSSASLAYADPRRLPPPPPPPPNLAVAAAAEVDRWAWRSGASDETDDDACDEDEGGSEAAYACGSRSDADLWSSREASAGVSRGSWLRSPPPPPPIGFAAGQRSASAASTRCGNIGQAPASSPSSGYWTAERASATSGQSNEQFGERFAPQSQLPTIVDGSLASRARRCRSASNLSHELLAACSWQQQQPPPPQPPPPASDVRPAALTVDGVEWQRHIDRGRATATLDRRTFRPASAAPCDRAAGSRTTDASATGAFATLPHSRSNLADGGGYGTTRRDDDRGPSDARCSSAEGRIARVLVDHGRSSRQAAAAATQAAAAANSSSSTLSRKPAAAATSGSCGDPRWRRAGDLSRVAEELTDARQDFSRELYDTSATESSPSPPRTGRHQQPRSLQAELHHPQQQQQWLRPGGYPKFRSFLQRGGRSSSRRPSDDEDGYDDAVARRSASALERELTPT